MKTITSTSIFAIGYMFCCIQLCKTNQQGGTNEFPVVWTSYGPVRGQKFISPWTKKIIYAFKGIPFASKPTGALRFQDPIPAKKWTHVRDSTREESICPQPPSIYAPDDLPQSEDCLYLNVYTPKLPSRSNELLPVMVFIHGGIFTAGNGGYSRQGPDFLVAEGIVFVSLNYRLGALGQVWEEDMDEFDYGILTQEIITRDDYTWRINLDPSPTPMPESEKSIIWDNNQSFLNLGVPEAAGNVGLKDQLMALMWVQSEISHFGGDPQQVTLFGQSAGAMSIHMHYISPLSVGLFHRAIGDSGAAISYHDGVRDDAARYGLMLADRLNCSVGGEWGGRQRWRDDPPQWGGHQRWRDDPPQWDRHQSWRDDPPPLPGVQAFRVDPVVANNALKCLRAADFQDIVTAQSQVTDFLGDITGLNEFGPTIDRYSKVPFLPDFPFKLLEQKKGFFVPFLMGVNSDEGLIRLQLSTTGAEINNITNNYRYLYGLEVPQSCSGTLKAEKLGHFYGRYTGPEVNVKRFVDIYTDVLYAYGTSVNARKYQNTEIVFLYYFSFNGKFKSQDAIAVETKFHYSGVIHMEELNYLFVVDNVNQTAPYNSNEIRTLRRMVKMWTNFVKYGTPTVGPDPLLQNVLWLPASGGKTNHLNIDVNLRMVSEDLLAPRAALWDSITFNHCL